MNIYKLNKKNLTIVLFCVIIMVIAGTLFALYPTSFSESGLVRNPTIVRVIGIALVSIMMFFSIGLFIQLLDKYGLKITEKGFVNNTNLMNVGIIHWNDIEDIQIKKLKKNEMVLIQIRNEKKYYDRIKNPLKKINVLTYKKTYGASFVIEPKNIGCTAEELVVVLNKYKNQFLNSKQFKN